MLLRRGWGSIVTSITTYLMKDVIVTCHVWADNLFLILIFYLQYSNSPSKHKSVVEAIIVESCSQIKGVEYQVKWKGYANVTWLKTSLNQRAWKGNENDQVAQVKTSLNQHAWKGNENDQVAQLKTSLNQHAQKNENYQFVSEVCETTLSICKIQVSHRKAFPHLMYCRLSAKDISQ